MHSLLLLCIGMALVLGGILVLRLHAFLALIVGAYCVALLTPTVALRDYAQHAVAKGEMATKAADKFPDKPAATRVAESFGKTCGDIGILIAMAAIIGECLLVSGAAEKIATATLRVTGVERAQWAFFLTSFLLGIPVFLATLFCLLMPLARAMTRKTGRDYLLYVLCVVAGGTITHSLVPPAPGPVFVAGALGVNLGTMIIAGSAIGFGAALFGYIFGSWANRWMKIEPPPEPAATAECAATHALPPLGLALVPVLLPLVLIALNAALAPSLKDTAGAWPVILRTLGDKDMALTLGAAAAQLLVVRQRPGEKNSKTVQDALTHGAVIIAITAAGGAFGGALQQTGIADAFGALIGGAQSWALPAVFLITALVRTAQGSATVAMITAAPVAKALIDSGHTGIAPVYFAIAIGCGSKPFPWMNDAGFWVVARMSGMTEGQTLRTMSPMMSLQGIAGLVLTMLAAWLFPLR
jgi:GntP family gluconate:H+ symporter